MITPPVASMKEARADFEELVPISSVLNLHLAEGVHAGVRFYQSPEGEQVVLVSCEGIPEMEAVPALVGSVNLPSSAHLLFFAPDYPEGFDEALDAALGGGVKVTLRSDERRHPEVLAVPTPDPAPPVTVSLTISEADFNYLCENSVAFDPEVFTGMLETYAPGKDTATDSVDSHWKMAYTANTDGGYANVMMMTAFLKGHGYAYEVASTWDDDTGSEWWVLTDFKTASWRRHDAQVEVEERLKREAAEASGDPLLQAYHMPAAVKKSEEQSSGE